MEKTLKPTPDAKKSDVESSSAFEVKTRREFIGMLGLSCAALLSSNALAGIVLTARQPGGPVRVGQVLSENQMRLLRAFVETIIPQTDTPGAAETDTHGFIDDQLANCQAPDEAKRFIADLDKAGTLIEQRWGSTYSELTAQDQEAAMTAIAHKAEPFASLSDDFFQNLKSLTLLGYYSSKAGASEELVYLPIPGGYDGTFTVADNGGKTFSPRVF